MTLHAPRSAQDERSLEFVTKRARRRVPTTTTQTLHGVVVVVVVGHHPPPSYGGGQPLLGLLVWQDGPAPSCCRYSRRSVSTMKTPPPLGSGSSPAVTAQPPPLKGRASAPSTAKSSTTAMITTTTGRTSPAPLLLTTTIAMAEHPNYFVLLSSRSHWSILLVLLPSTRSLVVCQSNYAPSAGRITKNLRSASKVW